MLIKRLPLFDFIRALAQMIRLPNVLIIILTQILLRYCIILPYVYPDFAQAISPFPDFLILIFVTVLIAVGGYVINDYFDVKIDRINRPGNLVVGRLISAHTALKLHILLNGVAIILGFYLAWRIKTISFGFIFPFISGLLWIYSAKYKRVLIWGNLIVAGLSAFVILILGLFEFFWIRLDAPHFLDALPAIKWVTRVFIAYAAFAFLVSTVREIVKDMEDSEGDQTVGSQTLPLVTGMVGAKFVVGAILSTTIVLLAYAQVILYHLSLYMLFWYFMCTIQPAAVYFLVKLFFAREKQDYHFLSSLCKLIMVAGILSMEIILINN
jgi:4-hydroxybenzoate polyprenyltransferase